MPLSPIVRDLVKNTIIGAISESILEVNASHPWSIEDLDNWLECIRNDAEFPLDDAYNAIKAIYTNHPDKEQVGGNQLIENGFIRLCSLYRGDPSNDKYYDANNDFDFCRLTGNEESPDALYQEIRTFAQELLNPFIRTIDRLYRETPLEDTKKPLNDHQTETINAAIAIMGNYDIDNRHEHDGGHVAALAAQEAGLAAAVQR